MVGVVPRALSLSPADFRLGRQLLDVLTCGMYDDALMVYREYIQNSADAIDALAQTNPEAARRARIEIEIDGRARCITILDSGAGIPSGHIVGRLIPIGCSGKSPQTDRGFRGIGRLGGLAYCDVLMFETRDRPDAPVSCVTWEAARLRKTRAIPVGGMSLLEALRSTVQVHRRRAQPNEPPHFFRVTLKGVRRFHGDRLMDASVAANYLAQVAPVPYDSDRFSFAARVRSHLAPLRGNRDFQILLNGRRILRPYGDEIADGPRELDRIEDVVLFDLRQPDGGLLGVGWYARTNFRRAFPRAVLMRGLRVRQANIEIGNEYYLAGLYAERRFATWHVGEIELARGGLIPNARRDGFEQSAELERVLEQLTLLGRHLSRLCRSASKWRSATAKVAHGVARLALLAFSPVFIDQSGYALAVEGGLRRLALLERLAAEHPLPIDLAARLRDVAVALRSRRRPIAPCMARLDGRRLRHRTADQLLAHVSHVVLQDFHCAICPEDLLRRILGPYLRSSRGSGRPEGRANPANRATAASAPWWMQAGQDDPSTGRQPVLPGSSAVSRQPAGSSSTRIRSVSKAALASP